MKKTLWTKNYTILMTATVCGCIGGIAGNFALSFLVFDETGSTLASALILAIEMVPSFVIPLVAAPWMDRLPRKPFLVGGDLVNGVLYFLGGLYLMYCPFSYVGYLCFSLVLTSLGAFDSLAYNSIFPKLIPEGMEEKGYTVSSMLYPVLNVVMAPVAAVLLDWVGVPVILMFQGGCSILAAALECGIDIREENRMEGKKFSLALWWQDQKDAAAYLKNERGIRSIYAYMAMTNGVACGYSPLQVAFFRTTAGFTTAMYSLFSVAEFAGRSLGGVFCYKQKLKPESKFRFAFFVYQVYETMDMILLWLPYPLMLVNRAVCGFLGINSATMRYAAVQKYIPEEYRARLNAFEGVVIDVTCGLMTLIIGAAGELMDYRLCMTVFSGITLAWCWLTIWKNRNEVRRIYGAQNQMGSM